MLYIVAWALVLTGQVLVMGGVVVERPEPIASVTLLFLSTELCREYWYDPRSGRDMRGASRNAG